MSGKADNKDLSLEGLRGVASVAVFLAHYVASFLPFVTHALFRNGGDIPRRYAWESVLSLPFFTVFMNGDLAVQIFFVLSGYVLTKKFYDTGDVLVLQVGAVKRCPRLVIPALASCIFAGVLSAAGTMYTWAAPQIGAAGWPMSSYAAPIDVGTAISSGLKAVFFAGPTVAVNAPLWTIYYEMFGSVILFGVYALFGGRRPLVTFVAFLTAVLLLSAGTPQFLYFVAIFLGSLIHRVEATLHAAPRASAGFAVLGVVVGAFDYSGIYAGFHNIDLAKFPWPFLDLEANETVFYTTVGSFLLIMGVIGCRPLASVFAGKLGTFLGSISFSIYLIHWPIICSMSFGIMKLLVADQGWTYGAALIATTVVTLPVTVTASWLMARYVDRPATALAGRFARWVLHPDGHTALAGSDGLWGHRELIGDSHAANPVGIVESIRRSSLDRPVVSPATKSENAPEAQLMRGERPL